MAMRRYLLGQSLPNLCTMFPGHLADVPVSFDLCPLHRSAPLTIRTIDDHFDDLIVLPPLNDRFGKQYSGLMVETIHFDWEAIWCDDLIRRVVLSPPSRGSYAPRDSHTARISEQVLSSLKLVHFAQKHVQVRRLAATVHTVIRSRKMLDFLERNSNPSSFFFQF
jgi:hypothetical protein